MICHGLLWLCGMASLPIWFVFFFFKQKTAYEIGTGDWSSDVCSSDLDLFAAWLTKPVKYINLLNALTELFKVQQNSQQRDRKSVV